MYLPKYNISNAILKNIGIIEACREVVENAPLIPAYERQFQDEARTRTVHHGTHIEGNDLSFAQAERVLMHAKLETNAEKVAEKADLVAKERDIQEIINYRITMEYVDDLFKQSQDRDSFNYTENLIKNLHKTVVHRIVADGVIGRYRETQVVLKDSRTGEVTFRPPPAVEVPYLMEDFLTWLNSKSGRDDHPVLRAGIAHYVLAAIHPFVEGNGRASRAFATLLLFVEGYDIKKLFSLEEYFDRDAESYYRALITTSSQSGDLVERELTLWLEYFTQGLAIELSKIRDRVRKLSIDTRIKIKRGQQVLLSERQIKIVEYLSANGRGGMAEFRALLPMVSEDTVLRELQDLVGKNIIKKKGKTKGSFYELVT